MTCELVERAELSFNLWLEVEEVVGSEDGE